VPCIFFTNEFPYYSQHKDECYERLTYILERYGKTRIGCGEVEKNKLLAEGSLKHESPLIKLLVGPLFPMEKVIGVCDLVSSPH